LLRVSWGWDGPAVVALTSVTCTTPDVIIDQVNLDISYKGRFATDGKSITGAWTQRRAENERKACRELGDCLIGRIDVVLE
jgi:hypothetical protein